MWNSSLLGVEGLISSDVNCPIPLGSLTPSLPASRARTPSPHPPQIRRFVWVHPSLSWDDFRHVLTRHKVTPLCRSSLCSPCRRPGCRRPGRGERILHRLAGIRQAALEDAGPTHHRQSQERLSDCHPFARRNGKRKTKPEEGRRAEVRVILCYISLSLIMQMSASTFHVWMHQHPPPPPPPLPLFCLPIRLLHPLH